MLCLASTNVEADIDEKIDTDGEDLEDIGLGDLVSLEKKLYT